MNVADPYRPVLPPSDLVAAGLFLATAGRPRSWLLLRGHRSREWGFPKGHQDPGEELIQAALRETVEETGIALVAITAPPTILHYRVPSGRAKSVVYYPATTRTTTVVLSSEHQEFRWVPDQEVAPLLSHPNLRKMFLEHLKQLPPC